MTQQSILHLVVNCEVFTINICCYIVKILCKISSLLVWVIKLGLRSGGKIYTTMQNYVKIGHTRYQVFFLFLRWPPSANLTFQIFKFLVDDRVGTTNVHRHTNFIKIDQIIADISHLIIVKMAALHPVSYTHLTLPTILRV